MATSGFQINGTDIANAWPTKEYFQNRYPELADTFKQSGLYLWGWNGYGQLGTSDRLARSSPVQTIAGGTNWRYLGGMHGNASSAIKTDGTLWMWGNNTNGNLGDNTTVNKSSPVQTVSATTNWKQVGTGGSATSNATGAIKTDGTLWMWGRNSAFGILGNNTTTQRSSPVQTIAGGTNWKQLSLGTFHTSAIKTDGTLWLWGYNVYGQLGTNNTLARSSPVQTIAGGTNWKQVSAGWYTTACIKTDGTLWSWGYNILGQLGTNNTLARSSPVQTIAGGTNWAKLAKSGSSAAIKTDGTLWLWGGNASGALGDNTTTRRSSPVQTIAGGTNWSKIGSSPCFDNSVASTVTMSAIKTDGTLWLWGAGALGALGNDSTTSRSSPVQTIATGSNWTDVTSRSNPNSENNVMAIRDNSDDYNF